MELTCEADYAVRVLLDLAEHGAGRPVPSRDIARRQLIPRPFLAKVVQRLARRGYVRTRRGTGGGVVLAADPRRLRLRAVIQAVEGPIRLNRCLVGPGACPLVRRCPVHPVWRRIQQMLLRELERETIAALCRARGARAGAGGGPRCERPAEPRSS